MPRTCEKCKAIVSVITKDITALHGFVKTPLQEAGKKKQRRDSPADEQ